MKKLVVATLVLLLAACASQRPVDVDSRQPRNESRPAPVESAPPAPGNTTPAPPAATPKKWGGAYYKDDGPGDNPPPDMASIPDAQPKAEPLLARANRPYQALGQSYTPMQSLSPYKASGVASWYGRRFNGMPTSSGERYDMYGMTAAHPTLPIPCYVRVTNLENGRSVIVRVNDRGPFHKERLIDLSYTAAWKLGYAEKGSTRVEVELIQPGDTLIAAAPTPAPAMPPVVTSTTANAAPPSSVSSGLYLQLGNFVSRRNAEGFRDTLQETLGKLRDTLQLQTDGERTRVLLGPYASMAEAREVAERVAELADVRPFPLQR